MNLKTKNKPKRCSTCVNYRQFRGKGGECIIYNTRIENPDKTVCYGKGCYFEYAFK